MDLEPEEYQWLKPSEGKHHGYYILFVNFNHQSSIINGIVSCQIKKKKKRISRLVNKYT